MLGDLPRSYSLLRQNCYLAACSLTSAVKLQQQIALSTADGEGVEVLFWENSLPAASRSLDARPV